MALEEQTKNGSLAAVKVLSPTISAHEIARLRRLRMQEADREFARTVRELKRVTRMFRDKLKSL